MDIQYIANYWDRQAVIWKEEKDEAWTLPQTKYWLQYFKDLRPTLSGNKVLEVGTASGYFANILTLAGYEVTAVDLSKAMIEQAKQVSKDLNLSVKYKVMDAQDLRFKADSFDLIFTRLMTWTLPNVPLFYKTCLGILKYGGTFINFDGDMGSITFSKDGHERYPSEIMEQANIIKAQLEVSKHARPQLDIDLLEQVGFSDVQVDMNKQNRILQLPDGEYSLFELKAIKN